MTKTTTKLSTIKMLFIAGLVMMIVFGSMFYIYTENAKLGDKYEPQLLATMDIRLHATQAHLRLEGLAARDSDEGIDAVWRHLNEAEEYANTMLNGGESSNITFTPTQDPELRDNIKDVLFRLSNLKKITTQWQQNNARNTSTKANELQFDMAYAILMQDTHTVKRKLLNKIQIEQHNSQQIQIVLAIFSFALGIFVTIMFGQYIRQINKNMRDLQETHEELEYSNRDLASFAYIASHDLREPLRKIQAFGDRLLNKESEHLSPRGKDYIERMQKAATRMKDLIEALLNYSRIGTKGEPLTRIDLNTTMQDVLDDLEYSINEVNAKITIDKLPTIDADKIQIRQVFQNLIANALKFHRPDVAPVIHITSSISYNVCTLIFTDNGIGFEPEYAERIFGVFQRLHGRDSYSGTGIGLSICQKTAERHGGSITAEGRPNNGATFRLTLPVKQEEKT